MLIDNKAHNVGMVWGIPSSFHLANQQSTSFSGLLNEDSQNAASNSIQNDSWVKRGKKLGNALIIYGILNFLISFAFGIPYIVIGALIWMIILIALGNWQRSKARSEKTRDEQTELLRRIERKSLEKENDREDGPRLSQKQREDLR